MLQTIIFLLIILIISITILLTPTLIKQKRNRIKNRPFPPLWNSIIENNIPIYPHLSPTERRRLQGHVQVFLSEKQFIGCNGLQVTEEMKVIIAAVACLLLLNERGKYFPKLRSILIYPTAYFTKETTVSGKYVVEEKPVVRLGESWSKDQLILSWQHIKQDTQNWKDGQNIILHEFAHQLDQEEGKVEGVPILQNNSDYSNWSKVMTQEYNQLCNDVEQGRKTVMYSYGATRPAEFLSVATETFFEKPQQLLNKHPELYQLLQNYYQLDPVKWDIKD
ncbi:MAG: M90 family metallopeptidase [Cyanobacteriota bacterium]|nr:M90 family metallopeptidase [Cyanobacteriota bacterium]